MSEPPTEGPPAHQLGKPGVAATAGVTSAAAGPAESAPSKLRERWAPIGLVAGPILFFLVLVLPVPGDLSPPGHRVAAVALLMAVWWMTEALPLAATSLLPIVLFPTLGVMSAGEATAPFADDIIYLFLGGFCIALAMQRWGLHRRLALSVVEVVGTQPRRLVLGFMIATAFVSAWMSNTATTVMMLPIGIAVLAVVEKDEPGPLGTALTLSIAYAASIGGLATLIGTPPNVIFAAASKNLAGRSIGFLDWMYVGVPMSITMLVVTYWLLVGVVFPLPKRSTAGGAAKQLIRAERLGLGPMSVGERATATLFALTAAGWIFREPKEIGSWVIPGIASAFPMVRDSSVAIGGALALFMIPVSFRRREFVLDWKSAGKLPWDILLLIGGGLALANGFAQSGLSAWIGQQVSAFASVPTIVLIALIAVVFCALTELTSNTATTSMAMPIMASVASGVGSDPVFLMGAACLASSSAYMLPVATPPNAIVFAAGRVTIGQMLRAGVRMEIISVMVVTLVIYFLFPLAFGIAR